jgi:hypothetical protein
VLYPAELRGPDAIALGLARSPGKVRPCYDRRRVITAFFTKTRWRAIAFTSFVALVWLNQSLGGADWEAFRDRTLADPSAHVVDAVRYPFMFLYRRAPDEALYYATASATLGRPYDVDIRKTRGDSPLPPLGHPEDGRFHMPYAEVPLEYPPPNLPFVIAPRVVTSTFATYAYAFGALMGALLLAAGLIAARLGSRARASGDSDPTPSNDESERIFALGLLLLAHGAIAIQRLDAIVALLLVLMVRSAIRRDDATLGFWGGLLGATKFVPILVLPVLVIASGVRGGKRLAAIALGATAGLALGLGPMIVMGRESLPAVLAYHAARGLHVESTLGVVYGTVKAVLGRPEAALLDYGSFNFHGRVADLLAKAALPLTLVLVGIVGYASRPLEDPETDPETARTSRIVLAALAATTALWLGGKVFSPQYLTWALPLVLALPGRSWIRISVALGLVVLVSQIYLRGYYDHVYNQWPAGVITMVVRLALLAVLSRMLLVRLRRPW